MAPLFFCLQKGALHMIHIHTLEDCSLIDNPELYREIASYLLYCRMELQEYEDGSLKIPINKPSFIHKNAQPDCSSKTN